MSIDPPPEAVLCAFGVGPVVRRMKGGQGTTWVSGTSALKPGGGPVHQWIGETLAGLDLDGVRMASPVAAVRGAWTVDGWTATRLVAGREPDLTLPSSLVGIIEAGRAFHRAVAHLRRPDFVDQRDDPWAHGDRVAWGEQPMQFLREFASLAERLRAQPDPPGRAQVAHGDLTGNVLFAPGLPPAVIDVSPYWRPPSYAEGVVIADALCWHDADGSVAGLLGVPVAAVARALLFRMATSTALVTSGAVAVNPADEAQRYESAALAIGI